MADIISYLYNICINLDKLKNLTYGFVMNVIQLKKLLWPLLPITWTVPAFKFLIFLWLNINLILEKDPISGFNFEITIF